MELNQVNVSGSWSAQFEFQSSGGIPLYPPVLFFLTLTQTWLGRVHGTAWYDPQVGLPREAEVHGAVRGKTIRYTQAPRGRYVIGPQGFQITGELVQPAQRRRLIRKASPYDITFEGTFTPAGDEARGRWYILQWTLEQASRRKVQWVSIWGTWWMRRDEA
jgi:hypothetical protein